jgi:hypothetical protein
MMNGVIWVCIQLQNKNCSGVKNAQAFFLMIFITNKNELYINYNGRQSTDN